MVVSRVVVVLEPAATLPSELTTGGVSVCVVLVVALFSMVEPSAAGGVFTTTGGVAVC